MSQIEIKKTLSVIILSLFYFFSSGQNKSQFIDGREGTYCSSTEKLISEMPKEVLFGIQINSNGEVYFSMSDKNWFDKIFRGDSYGVSVDIVSKSRYNCSVDLKENTIIPKGIVLTAIYKKQLLQNSNELMKGEIYTKIGKLPPSLMGKEVEGNLIILNGSYMCYYTNFVDIDRNLWQLLPMGFYTDSLLNEYTDTSSLKKDFFTYSKKVYAEIPFSKGSSTFEYSYLKKYFDSLNISSSIIRKIEIRAYSSVEGPEAINKQLMAKRAESMIAALKKYQASIKRINVITAENWLDFFRDIKDSKFAELNGQSKLEIKKRLTDPKLIAEIEPILSHHRKAVAILYLEIKSSLSSENDSSILRQFKAAISFKQIAKAQSILREISERILDKRLPTALINKIEVPATKEYSPVLNDREVYKYLLRETDEYEAFDNLIGIRKIDSTNGKVNYNICVLRFFLWQYGDDQSSKTVLPKEINALAKENIPETLVKRMRINYYILKSEDQMNVFNYKGKDSSLNEIRNMYGKIAATDEEIYSLAKYYSFYSHEDWAQEIIQPRIASIDVSENLIFYYLNLLFFQPAMYESDEFRKATLNAVNLNTKRFCSFFNPINKGGASMQLLEHAVLKSFYCSECVK
ncbi:MAG TPA: hypothetical protein VKT28_05685 [Puia sp.]|nr:hypothetical protein [Puia sp.]